MAESGYLKYLLSITWCQKTAMVWSSKWKTMWAKSSIPNQVAFNLKAQSKSLWVVKRKPMAPSHPTGSLKKNSVMKKQRYKTHGEHWIYLSY